MADSVMAFLSHSSADKEVVHRVKNDLDRHGIMTWLDEFQIGFGDSIRREIEAGISSSNFLVLFLSKRAIESEWVNREIDAAFAREIESKDTTIIPVLLENCDIPLTLQGRRHIDMRSDVDAAIRSLIDALMYPRRSILKALVGRWTNDTGALYLSVVGNLIFGKFDWGEAKSGNISGHLEKNRVKFKWSWDYSADQGMGIFDLDQTFEKLDGGWWSDEDINPDASLESLAQQARFHPWSFIKGAGKTAGKITQVQSYLALPLNKDGAWGTLYAYGSLMPAQALLYQNYEDLTSEYSDSEQSIETKIASVQQQGARQRIEAKNRGLSRAQVIKKQHKGNKRRR